MIHKNKCDYVALLFYASWCPFSRSFRPSFDVISSLYSSIPHFAIKESSVKPRWVNEAPQSLNWFCFGDDLLVICCAAAPFPSMEFMGFPLSYFWIRQCGHDTEEPECLILLLLSTVMLPVRPHISSLLFCIYPDVDSVFVVRLGI